MPQPIEEVGPDQARQVHKLEQRLDPATLAALVDDYAAGMSSTELQEKYSLGKASVLRLLAESGVEVRRRSLKPEQVTRVGRAIPSWAGQAVAAIREQANAWLVSIKGGVDKATVNPHGGIAHSTVSWDEDAASVAKNDAFRKAIADQQELLWAAERKCANAIYDLTGHVHVEAVSAANPKGYGFDDLPDVVDMPWGQQVKRTEHCGEKAVTAVGHFFGEGIIVGLIGVGFQAVGGLFGVTWDQKGLDWNFSTAVTSWQGMALLARAAEPSTLTLALAGDKDARDSYKAVWAAAKGTVAADKWAEDPAAAAGETVGNLALLFIGLGEVSAAAKGAGAAAKAGSEPSRAASALRVGSKVAEFTDPLALALKAAKFAGKGSGFSMSALSGLFKNLDFAHAVRVDFSPKKFDIYLAAVEHNSTSVDLPNKHLSHSDAPAVHDRPQSLERTSADPTRRRELRSHRLRPAIPNDQVQLSSNGVTTPRVRCARDPAT